MRDTKLYQSYVIFNSMTALLVSLLVLTIAAFIVILINHDYADSVSEDIFNAVVPALILISVAALLVSVILGWVLRFKHGYKSRIHTLMTVLSVFVVLTFPGAFLLVKLTDSLTSRPQGKPITVQPAPPAPTAQQSKIEIKVMADGTLFADGQPVTLDELRPLLAKLKEEDGTVWYYREVSPDEPPTIATGVIDLVIEHELDVTLSTKPDFSDAVGPDGVPVPR